MSLNRPEMKKEKRGPGRPRGSKDKTLRKPVFRTKSDSSKPSDFRPVEKIFWWETELPNGFTQASVVYVSGVMWGFYANRLEFGGRVVRAFANFDTREQAQACAADFIGALDTEATRKLQYVTLIGQSSTAEAERQIKTVWIGTDVSAPDFFMVHIYRSPNQKCNNLALQRWIVRAYRRGGTVLEKITTGLQKAGELAQAVASTGKLHKHRVVRLGE